MYSSCVSSFLVCPKHYVAFTLCGSHVSDGHDQNRINMRQRMGMG